MSDAGKQGQFVWYDLMTSDPKAAEDFYGQLIGWGTQPMDGGDKPYKMWTNNEIPLGGVMELPEEARAAGAPPNWIAYVAVENVDAIAEETVRLEGSILHPPTSIEGAGRFAVLADPQGAVFAVYAHSGEEEESPSGPPQVGQFSWHELATSDYKKALSFYSDLFGWTPQDAMDMGEAGIYQLYGRGGAPMGGMFNKFDEMPGPPMWLFYISVDDVTAAVEKVNELGGQVVNGPIEVPGGDFIAQCLDPQGALFALHSTAPSG
jgi:predicted enzyme related to lactoylglutathione lyase